MSDPRGYDHQHIDVDGNLPETFRFHIHPEPTLAQLDAIPDGSEVVLVAWPHDFPPPRIEGFEMTEEWRDYHMSRVLSANPEARDMPRDEVAFGNLFLFSLPPVAEHEGVPSEDDIIDTLVVRDEYPIEDVRLLVREAVRRAREGMAPLPF